MIFAFSQGLEKLSTSCRKFKAEELTFVQKAVLVNLLAIEELMLSSQAAQGASEIEIRLNACDGIASCPQTKRAGPPTSRSGALTN